ncbi:MAG: hypothetical protein UY35_C0005G0003 [Candidatus Saccharibacteria bacterium GW2011_GWC2_48_9]|nr:MAG: hypothetical protein UY35_C0005G0003 [Candidatus Saccharibacteria bacterium GW2011_GWC2_48_9]
MNYTISMTKNDIPDWIQKLDLSRPVDPSAGYHAIVDEEILAALQQLSLKELDELADISGVRAHQGVLTPPNESSREEYVEILSDVGEMVPPQIVRIREYLGIKST